MGTWCEDSQREVSGMLKILEAAGYPINSIEIIAVSEDIDPNNADAIFWSIAYRSNVSSDVHITPYRSGGHGPKSGRSSADATLMIDATLKADMPPLALPREQFMSRAKVIWEELQLPRLTPQPPWHGYELGDWSDQWSEYAERAVAGEWEKNGLITHAGQKGGMKPEIPVRDFEK